MARDREQAIRERAYEIWQQEGRPEGRAVEHWILAERALAGSAEPPQSEQPPAQPGETDPRREPGKRELPVEG